MTKNEEETVVDGDEVHIVPPEDSGLGTFFSYHFFFFFFLKPQVYMNGRKGEDITIYIITAEKGK